MDASQKSIWEAFRTVWENQENADCDSTRTTKRRCWGTKELKRSVNETEPLIKGQKTIQEHSKPGTTTWWFEKTKRNIF